MLVIRDLWQDRAPRHRSIAVGEDIAVLVVSGAAVAPFPGNTGGHNTLGGTSYDLWTRIPGVERTVG